MNIRLFFGNGELKDTEGGYDESGILKELSVSADWSTSGARELLKLADEYGAFMLRNALAIAVVLGKEDGSEGFLALSVPASATR